MILNSENIDSRSFIKNKYNKDYTEVTILVYKLLSLKYGYTIRISDIFQLIKDSFGINDFELFNPLYYNIGPFESYIMDELINWQQGIDINFSDIYRSILTIGDFTESEKDMFRYGNIEERLWAIYLSVSNPMDNDILKINN